jgi:DDE family transposase
MRVIPQSEFPFEPGRTLRAVFDAEPVSSDGGAVLLQELDRRLGLTEALARCIPDNRDARYVSHSVVELLRQRIYGIALGYEDCNDAQTLRHDSVMKVLCGRDPAVGDALASQPSLSRLETSATWRTCYRLSVALLDAYLDRHPQAPTHLTVDFDDSEDPTHGQQQLSFFNAHYNTHLYFPFFIFDGEGDLMTVVLLPGKKQTGKTMASILKRVVRRVADRWPQTRVLLRADSQFSSASMLRMCRHTGAEFLFGLTPNKVLKAKAKAISANAEAIYKRTQKPVRIFTSTWHQARTASWPRSYRLVIKAEHTALGGNVRFVITTLAGRAEDLYDHYVQRGEACENSIKDIKNALKADRLSCHAFWANHFRLLLHASAYVLMFCLRKAAHGTELQVAQMDTLRLRLLKIAVRVASTVRHVWFHLTAAHPWQAVWHQVAKAVRSRAWLLPANA